MQSFIINDDAGIIPETQYHTFSEVGTMFNGRSMGELTTLYLNTSSLPKKLSKLEHYLNSMNTIVDIIAISESKITKTVNVSSIWEQTGQYYDVIIEQTKKFMKKGRRHF